MAKQKLALLGSQAALPVRWEGEARGGRADSAGAPPPRITGAEWDLWDLWDLYKSHRSHQSYMSHFLLPTPYLLDGLSGFAGCAPFFVAGGLLQNRQAFGLGELAEGFAGNDSPSSRSG